MSETIIAYCMRCRKKQEVKDPKVVTVKGKGNSTRRACQGVCPVCGTKMFKFLPKENISDSTTMETPTGESTTTDIEKEMENFDNDDE